MRTRASHSIRRKRCFALVIVLSLLAVATVLVTALFSLSHTEHKSSRNYQARVEADHLSEVAKNVVISQIRKATLANPKEGISWSSQPGAIRTYGKGTTTAYKSSS